MSTPNCKTCRFGSTLVVGNQIYYGCTLPYEKKIECAFNVYCYYAPIEDCIIPPVPKENNND